MNDDGKAHILFTIFMLPHVIAMVWVLYQVYIDKLAIGFVLYAVIVLIVIVHPIIKPDRYKPFR